MRRIAFAAVLCLAATGSTALAADLQRPSYYAATAPVTAFGWTGAYLGGNIGYEWGATSNNPTRPSGVAGGIQGGYNWQTGQLVFGGEADLQLSDANDTVTPWKFSNPWFGTIRGRAGYAFSNFLVYGTGGIAFGELEAQTIGLVTESHSSFGWTAGLGLEAGLTQSLSAKVEYLYIDLASNNFAVTAASNGYTASVVRAGLNYHF
jgi:outer membrane immunogenic protein